MAPRRQLVLCKSDFVIKNTCTWMCQAAKPQILLFLEFVSRCALRRSYSFNNNIFSFLLFLSFLPFSPFFRLDHIVPQSILFFYLLSLCYVFWESLPPRIWNKSLFYSQPLFHSPLCKSWFDGRESDGLRSTQFDANA